MSKTIGDVPLHRKHIASKALSVILLMLVIAMHVIAINPPIKKHIQVISVAVAAEKVEQKIEPAVIETKEVSPKPKQKIAAINNLRPQAPNEPVASKEVIRAYVVNAFKKAGLNMADADKIITCESGWNEYAISKTGKYVGLWQISKIHNLPDSCRFDYACSTDWAIKTRLHQGHWEAWSCS